MNATKTTRIYGETLAVEYDGMWVSPCNGQQHATAREAMRAEIERLIRDSGDDPSERESAIVAALDAMV